MLRSPIRRVDLRASWQRAKAQFAAIVAERDSLKHELACTEQRLAHAERERDQYLATIRDMLATRTAARHARAELADLYRERALARAQAVERDPSRPLH